MRTSEEKKTHVSGYLPTDGLTRVTLASSEVTMYEVGYIHRQNASLGK